jgi:hypothetical protein
MYDIGGEEFEMLVLESAVGNGKGEYIEGDARK